MVLVVVWNTGALDKVLVNVGLNKTTCVQNGFGSTYCGDDAKSYCENVSNTIGRGNSGEGCKEVLNER